MVHRLAPGLGITVNETVHRDGRRSSVLGKIITVASAAHGYLLVAPVRCFARLSR